MKIDYNDFVQYADENLSRSDDCFKKNDLRYAAFSAHEAIELYLKAYLIKFNIISDPVEAGHLSYPIILKKLEEEFKKEIRKQKNLTDKNFWLTGVNHLQNIISILADMKKRKVTITLWKNSMNIQLNGEENEILQKIESRLTASTGEGLKEFGTYLSSDSFKSKLTNKKLNQSPAAKQVGDIMVKYYKLVSEDPNTDLSLMGNELYTLTKPMLQAKTGFSFPKETTTSIFRLFVILRTMGWMGIMVYSFSHQQISRYPTEIDCTTAAKLYQENKECLGKFIQRVYSTSQDIKTAIANPY